MFLKYEEEKRMRLLLRIQGVFWLGALVSFLVGYFDKITWLMILGGIIVAFDDVLEIFNGILNPIFPVILALVLAVVFTPWYVGIFWASAAFKVLDIPGYLKMIFTPDRVIEKAQGY
ncbi:MAG: hypothetical protein COX51_08015 [Syntrophobacteraceae bacterium CG23_combo_of_CG06-09_8_20_14_all_50_8]|nr:MAG: hypothetical protein COX51_08015 [Syntrophobacteraceae bacterium CG23_combo_of_CG06-09_8_20_14_all_50_8]